MTPAQETALRTLHEIGGWVSEDEVAYQLGAGAVPDLHSAAADGLVEVRVDFSITEAGEAAIGVGR